MEESFTALHASMIGWAVVAGVGGVAFILALSTPPPPAGAASGSGAGASAPVVTTMKRLPGTGADQLWSALNLTACETPGQLGTVPVLLLGGAGTAAGPYQVHTIPSKGCTTTQFTVVSDVAVVDTLEPPEVTITYAPTPSPSATS